MSPAPDASYDSEGSPIEMAHVVDSPNLLGFLNRDIRNVAVLRMLENKQQGRACGKIDDR